MLEASLFEQAPELKIGLSLLAAGFITSGALVLCWLTGSDPWGKLLPLAFCFCAPSLTSLRGWQPIVLMYGELLCMCSCLAVHHLLLSVYHRAFHHFFISFSSKVFQSTCVSATLFCEMRHAEHLCCQKVQAAEKVSCRIAVCGPCPPFVSQMKGAIYYWPPALLCLAASVCELYQS